MSLGIVNVNRRAAREKAADGSPQRPVQGVPDAQVTLQQRGTVLGCKKDTIRIYVLAAKLERLCRLQVSDFVANSYVR